MGRVRWLVQELRGPEAVEAYLWAVGSEPTEDGWIIARAEEPMWTRLRQTTTSRQVKQTALPDEMLRPGGNSLLDTKRRALIVPPDRRVAYYVWDGSGWRELPPGDARGALDRYRQGLVGMLRRLFAEDYPAEVSRVHVELYDNFDGEVDLKVFFFDDEDNEVFVDTPKGPRSPTSLSDRDLACPLSFASAYPTGWDEPDVAGVPIEDSVVLGWLGECAVEAGVAGCGVQVTASFHDDKEWVLGANGARPAS